MKAHSFALLAVFALRLPANAHPQNEHMHAPEKLGIVNFSTSCADATRPQFNRAVALMHSFQFAQAIEAFRGILKEDPSCAMADWGIALSNWSNPFAAGLKSPLQLEQGLKAVDAARELKPKTPREQAYIEAVAHLFTDTAKLDQRTRILAYESAMAEVHAAYPEDDEAAIFYALAVAAAADPADKTYERQLKAGKILDTLYAKYPDHPGLAHYIIHAYDVPPLAARAAGAAQHYSEIAPATSHALHMPSHTFTRMGQWQASIDTNIASAAAAKRVHQPAEELHASDYLVYAYLQTAQDGAALNAVESSREVFARFDPAVVIGGAAGPSAAYFARAAIPARYALERHAWAEAGKLEPVPSQFPYTDAMTWFARGLGSAHLKDHAAAVAAIDALAQCRDQLTQKKESYWANQVEIQRREVAAWLEFAEGQTEPGLTAMREAAAMEDKTEKNAITPGPLAPARELLADMLLQSNRPAEAKKEFEQTLAKEPNRFWTLYGAAESAKLSGDPAKAREYFAQLLKVAERADTTAGRPTRPELVEAQTALTAK